MTIDQIINLLEGEKQERLECAEDLRNCQVTNPIKNFHVQISDLYHEEFLIQNAIKALQTKAKAY